MFRLWGSEGVWEPVQPSTEEIGRCCMGSGRCGGPIYHRVIPWVSEATFAAAFPACNERPENPHWRIRPVALNNSHFQRQHTSTRAPRSGREPRLAVHQRPRLLGVEEAAISRACRSIAPPPAHLQDSQQAQQVRDPSDRES